MKKLWIWLLILVSAGTAFYMSFRNSIDMASMASCDDGNMLCVTVLNKEPERFDEPLLLKIDYFDESKTLENGAGRKPFPQPFCAVLVSSENKIVAKLGVPDEHGNVPAIEAFPRNEKYFWVGFPQVKVDGKPASLLIKNPFFGMKQ